MSTQEITLEDTRSGTETNTLSKDHLLVAQAKSGDSGAFGELYERYRHKLYRSAFRILRHQQDAEDAVQRSFQRALTSLTGFREDSTFSTWITRVVIDEALMLLRQRRMHSSICQAQNDDGNEIWELGPADERPTPEQVLAQNELRDLVTWAISRLGANLQSVVLLRELQGLTSAETARRLGLTISAVKARIFHARRHLRRHLAYKYRPRRNDVLVDNRGGEEEAVAMERKLG